MKYNEVERNRVRMMEKRKKEMEDVNKEIFGSEEEEEEDVS